MGLFSKCHSTWVRGYRKDDGTTTKYLPYYAPNERNYSKVFYEFRSISIEEETTDMTKEDILQAIKEMEGLKLW